jgi:hypothetical protein
MLLREAVLSAVLPRFCCQKREGDFGESKVDKVFLLPKKQKRYYNIRIKPTGLPLGKHLTKEHGMAQEHKLLVAIIAMLVEALATGLVSLWFGPAWALVWLFGSLSLTMIVSAPFVKEVNFVTTNPYM